MLQLPELAARFEPELVGEDCTAGHVHVERLGLASGAVQRKHELPSQMLAQRVCAHESLELSDHVCVTPAGEVRPNPGFDTAQSKLGEARDLALRERLVREVGERVLLQSRSASSNCSSVMSCSKRSRSSSPGSTRSE